MADSTIAQHAARFILQHDLSYGGMRIAHDHLVRQKFPERTAGITQRIYGNLKDWTQNGLLEPELKWYADCNNLKQEELTEAVWAELERRNKRWMEQASQQ